LHREDLLFKLARYVPLDERDDVQRRKIEDFVRQHPECFERSLALGHLTGSAWLVDASGDRVLLTHHRKLHKWLQLGGHADGDPDLLAVALREAREESGIADIVPVMGEIFDLDIHPIPQIAGEPLHDHYDIRFLLQVHGPDDFVVSDESHALAWFTPADLITVELDEAVLRMCVKWQKWRQARGLQGGP
jgi:8-oxo-dGTP pyrophosphatase MutT (NUDIX family)